MNDVYAKAKEKGIVSYMKAGGELSSSVNDIFDEDSVEEASSRGKHVFSTVGTVE